MPPESPETPEPHIPALRVWPAALLLLALWGLKISLHLGSPSELTMPLLIAWFLGPLACAGLLLLWWGLFSRATPREKILGLVGLVVIGAGTMALSHPSLIGAGTLLHVVPWSVSVFALIAVLLGSLRSRWRTGLALLAGLLAFGAWSLVRMDDVRGDMQASFPWRWEPTAEELFLESARGRESPADSRVGQLSVESLEKPEWPGFRGPRRDGVQPGVRLRKDWEQAPPREVWRVRVGPAWSSFAVAGSSLFTQEQRGELEAVVCRDAGTGDQIWAHESPARFWEAMGGAGPRSTPTLAGARVYALGATGWLRCLDARDGTPIWEKDVASLANREPPTWGFASSPLVAADRVIVHVGGEGDRGILALDAGTGELRWGAPSGDHGYSSPHLATIQGQDLVLVVTNLGLDIVDPATGQVRGRHDWPYSGYRVLQPLVLEGGDVLVGSGVGAGTRRLALRFREAGLEIETRWTSRFLSPDFNDAVAHEGHVYGFDKNIFTCVDLATGKRNWKRGRYGSGQVLLLPDGDQLLVLSESGELVLLETDPEQLVEVARHPVLEGRTWTHPVLVGNRLYVRNAEEAACFEMPVEEGESSSSPRGG